MKLGIIGTGMIVHEVLPVLKTIDNIEISALCGTIRSRDKVNSLAIEYNIEKCYTDYEEFLKGDFDTVYVALPNILHYEYGKMVLKAGKNAIIEKPFTVKNQEAEDLFRIADEKGLYLFEAITTANQNNFKVIKENIERLGDIKLVQCNFSQKSSRYEHFVTGDIAPVFDITKAGGALMDLNIYNIHYVTGLFGAPEAVSYKPNIMNGVDTSGVLNMDYGNFKAVCIGAKDSCSPASYLIQGVNGYIRQDTTANICGEAYININGKEELLASHDEINDKNNKIDKKNKKNKNDIIDKPVHRMKAEFIKFSNMIDEKIRTENILNMKNFNDELEDCDLIERYNEEYHEMKIHSLEVMRIVTAAARSAGLVYGTRDIYK